MSDEWVAGTDRSHYQGPLSQTLTRQLALHTHKVTDGDHFYEDAAYRGATTRAAGFGVPVLGSYHMLHGQRSIIAQAQWWYARVNELTPWWRTDYADTGGRAWTWQADCEAFSYFTAPTVAEINALGDAICALAGCPAECFMPYAPAWHYGAALKQLRYRASYWASAYGSNPAGDYRAVYPGNSSPRWSAAAIPALVLQYGSLTNLGDANAVRGTLAQFLTRLNPGGSVSGVVIDLMNTTISAPGKPYDGYTLNNVFGTILGRLPGDLGAQLVAILAAANHDPDVTVSLTPKDIATLAATIVVGVGAKIHDPSAAIAELSDRLVAGARAEAAALEDISPA